MPDRSLLAELRNESQRHQVALAEAELTIARAQLERLRNGERAERRRALDRQIAPPSKLHTILNGVPAPHENAQPHPGLAALRRGGPLVHQGPQGSQEAAVVLCLDIECFPNTAWWWQSRIELRRGAA